MDAQQKLLLLNARIEDHLDVSGLIRNILSLFNIVTIGDLCAIDIEGVANKAGVGVKKIETLKNLIAQAHILLEQEPPADFIDAVELVGVVMTPGDPLIYIPSILKTRFAHHGIRTIQELLDLDTSRVSQVRSWGATKVEMTNRLRRLYKYLCAQTVINVRLPLRSVVSVPLLPNGCLADITINDFLLGTTKLALRGKAIRDANDLRLMFSQLLPREGNSNSYDDMDWRDVPLQLSSRIAAFVDKHDLITVRDLREFSTYARIEDESGGFIDALKEENFGESSLASLRSELTLLQTIGVKQYRSRVICSIDDMDCSQLDWRDIPLRVSKRLKKFLVSHEISKISEVHRTALRSQVFCRSTQRWEPLTGISVTAVTELRKELTVLASHGLECYRFGSDGAPKSQGSSYAFFSSTKVS